MTRLTLCAMLLAVPLGAQGSSSQTFTYQFAGAAALGAAGLVGGAWIGYRVVPDEGGDDPGLIGTLLGGLVGSIVGSASGAYLVGRERGLPAAWIDGAGGAMLGWGAFLLLRPALQLDPDEGPAFWIVMGALPPLGAALFSHLGARHRLGPGALTIVPRTRGLAARVSVRF